MTQPSLSTTRSKGYLVLARKWRPQTFGEMVGQQHVTRSLQNALTSGRIPHAFLFAGIRGTGKTTLARLVAKSLLCESGITPEPCGRCAACKGVAAGSHADVMEIDAASRTKVEQMREVLDTVYYYPAEGRFKIYILDEVHMLSIGSFNALLKTLEEPPEHVKFMFATTELGKIPATILSRCQRYDLARVSRSDLSAHLENILTREEAPFDAEGVEAVARAADGSVRDALSLLDQVLAHGRGEVRLEAVATLLGLAGSDGMRQLLGLLLDGTPAALLQAVRQLYQQGVDPSAMVNGLLDAVHQVTLTKVVAPGSHPDRPGAGDPHHDAIQALAERCSLPQLQMYYQVLLRGVGDLRQASQPLQALEMLLLRVVHLLPVAGLDTLLDAMAPPVPGRGGGSGAGNAGGRGPAAGQDAPLSGAASRPQPPPVLEDATATAAPESPALPPQSSGQMPVPQVKCLTSWHHLVSLARQEDATLGVKLEDWVACPRFPPEGLTAGQALHLQMERNLDGSRLQKQLSQWLHAKLGGTVQVVIQAFSGKPTGSPTLGEQQRDHARRQRQAWMEQVRASPVFQDLENRFQGELMGIRPWESGQRQSPGSRPDA